MRTFLKVIAAWVLLAAAGVGAGYALFLVAGPEPAPPAPPPREAPRNAPAAAPVPAPMTAPEPEPAPAPKKAEAPKKAAPPAKPAPPAKTALLPPPSVLAAPSKTTAPKVFKPFSGLFSDESYGAQSYDGETVTIEIDTEKPIVDDLEVDARKGLPALKDDGRKADIEALLSLGATYVDIGFNTVRVAAEFPMEKIFVDRSFAEKAVPHLIGLKKKSKY